MLSSRLSVLLKISLQVIIVALVCCGKGSPSSKDGTLDEPVDLDASGFPVLPGGSPGGGTSTSPVTVVAFNAGKCAAPDAQLCGKTRAWELERLGTDTYVKNGGKKHTDFDPERVLKGANEFSFATTDKKINLSLLETEIFRATLLGKLSAEKWGPVLQTLLDGIAHRGGKSASGESYDGTVGQMAPLVFLLMAQAIEEHTDLYDLTKNLPSLPATADPFHKSFGELLMWIADAPADGQIIKGQLYVRNLKNASSPDRKWLENFIQKNGYAVFPRGAGTTGRGAGGDFDLGRIVTVEAV